MNSLITEVLAAILILLSLVKTIMMLVNANAWIETQDMHQLFKEQWLYISAWIALLLWGAYTLLYSVFNIK